MRTSRACSNVLEFVTWTCYSTVLPDGRKRSRFDFRCTASLTYGACEAITLLCLNKLPIARAVVIMRACRLFVFTTSLYLLHTTQVHHFLSTQLYNDLCIDSEPPDAFLFDYKLANHGCRLTCLVLRGFRFEKTTFMNETTVVEYTAPFNRHLCNHSQGVSV